ncbi:MAG: NADPH-dependent glutamate synthase [Lentisphaerae bacterium]|nr:NADPH-dependent glutamate synthase [Lentisphaerota bacterium]
MAQPAQKENPSTAGLRPRDRLAIPPQPMPEQDPAARRRNFSEVALGYTAEQARQEATRCLRCRNKPCVAGCPVRIDIPAFIKAVAEGDCGAAIAVIKRNSLLPAICGRVCPQETQCQAPCTVGKSLKDTAKSVSIGRLERYVADLERARGIAPPPVKPDTGRRVAVVGSGPAGLVAAADVRREGHAVTIFEAFHKPGGVMVYGIPEFRLPKAIVQAEIDTLAAMGVELRTSFLVGRTRTLRDLMAKDGYEAVFVGAGAGLPRFMGVEGENLVGVLSANEYLTRVNLMGACNPVTADTPVMRSRRVAVVGGGNVAMDAARTAVRLGAESVHVVYRRTEAEMPARIEEVHHAHEEGVVFRLLQNPKRIVGGADGRVTGMECLRYRLGEPDRSGRPRPVAIEGSEFMLDVDTVIVAIGNAPNPLIKRTTAELKTNEWGGLLVDDKGMTSMPGVFAGGDIVLGSATVIEAMGQGRVAAAAINEYLEEKG